MGAVPPPGVDRHGVPPDDEPRRPRAHPEHHAGRTGPRLARVPGRRGAAERPIPRALRARRPPAAGERRARNTRAVGAEGPAEDVRDVPRRPRAGVVGRAPRPLGRRDHVPAPHPPRPAAFRAITTLPQPAACTRWLGGSTAFAVLPAAVHGCRRVTGDVTEAPVKEVLVSRRPPEPRHSDICPVRRSVVRRSASENMAGCGRSSVSPLVASPPIPKLPRRDSAVGRVDALLISAYPLIVPRWSANRCASATRVSEGLAVGMCGKTDTSQQ